jgi:XTP/dITP diphosphohydrolase
MSADKLLFATHNKHKAEEIRTLLAGHYDVLTLGETGFHEDIPETGNTLEENAILKARYAFEKTGFDCFADDTGLEVRILTGEPGVYSARYAGTHGNSEANIAKLLTKLEGVSDRGACFRTVIALIIGNRLHTFEGIVDGIILHEKRGTNGFGYDPVFVPEGQNLSFAEMSLDEKNRYSHRARAIARLIDFLQNSK